MKKALLMAAAVLLIVCSCGSPRKEHTEPMREPPVQSKTDSDFLPTGPQRGEIEISAEESGPTAAEVEARVKVKTGHMTLVVEDIKKTEEALTSLCAEFGGYIARSQIVFASGILTIKIPEGLFDKAIAKVETLGRLKNKVITSEDVTDKYFDLENRVKNKRILLGRYQEYLKNARTTQDLITWERAVNTTTGELESLEGSFRNLNNSISFSTLTLSLELAPGQAPVIETPSLASGLRATAEFFLAFLYYFVLIILYILAVAIPLTLAGGLFYFVGFGRVGLVKKFFKALAPGKK
jgi:hypothetical protein